MAAGADGVNVDFESFAFVDRDSFTTFVTELTEAVHAWGGIVSVDITEPDVDALLFVDVAGVVTVLYQDGTAVGLATPAPNEFCGDDLPEHWDLELSEGLWQIEFGPSATDTVWLMLLESGTHAH